MFFLLCFISVRCVSHWLKTKIGNHAGNIVICVQNRKIKKKRIQWGKKVFMCVHKFHQTFFLSFYVRAFDSFVCWKWKKKKTTTPSARTQYRLCVTEQTANCFYFSPLNMKHVWHTTIALSVYFKRIQLHNYYVCTCAHGMNIIQKLRVFVIPLRLFSILFASLFRFVISLLTSFAL